MGKKLFFLFCSLLVTGLLLYYIFSQPADWSWNQLFSRFNLSYIYIYLGLYGVGVFLRTWRYQWLIKNASQQNLIPFFPLVLVTLSRNMLVDLLPARIGSLSYPILLNRTVGIELSHCLTSFTYAFIFDLLSLGPLLGMAFLWDGLKTSHQSPWLWLLAGIILGIGLLVLFLLEPLANTVKRWLQNRQKVPWKKSLFFQLEGIGHSLSRLKKTRMFWPLLGLSLLIRVIKYTLLYLMLLAVIEALLNRQLDLPFLTILLGLVGSEIAASLPISGLAGIGFYEGILGATLTGLGIKPVQGISLALIMHVLTQVVEYTLGIGALAYLFYRWMVKKKKIIV